MADMLLIMVGDHHGPGRRPGGSILIRSSDSSQILRTNSVLNSDHGPRRNRAEPRRSDSRPGKDSSGTHRPYSPTSTRDAYPAWFKIRDETTLRQSELVDFESDESRLSLPLMTEKKFLIRFKPSNLRSYVVIAANAEIHGEHLVFLRSDGSLAALFVLEVVESWSEVDPAGVRDR
jgi:hypothetical protein